MAVQFFRVSHILLLAHEPSLGGLEQYIERQNVIKRCVEDICGIALTLKDNPSSLMSSQALFIGELFNATYLGSSANQDIAGIFTQELYAREAILELLESCRRRTGWPVRPLSEELQQFWENQEPSKAATAAKLSMRPTL